MSHLSQSSELVYSDSPISNSLLSSSQQPGKFETYVCVEGHPCVVDLSDNHFCFVWSEVDEVFVPWVSTLKFSKERNIGSK